MDALIVGKGPSARQVGDPGIPVVALNGAAILCERIDWLVCNDVEMLAGIDSEDIRRADRLLLPAMMHCNRGKSLKSHRELRLQFMGRPVDLYELHSNPHKDPVLPCFGAIWSVGETAVAWLIHQGFTRIYTLGIDPGGGYANLFRDSGLPGLTKGWFQENHRRICQRAEEAGVIIDRWQR